ncbi:MAG: hypothetical protein AAF710_04640 [Planctomycetota bacterium]
MILNLIIVAFVLGMAVMWATYGLFSALLHLLVVVVAGALAFAFWELWVYSLLMGVMPTYAWGVGLVLPFAVLLIGLRLAVDRLVRGNVKFPRLADQIVGGAVGATSGALTAGVAVIGIGFLPLPPAIGGVQPYEVFTDGSVAPKEGGGLWLKVDSLAAGFYGRLSVGAFRSATPLAYYLPGPDKRAVVHRLAKFYDPNQSLVANPETVRVADEGQLIFNQDRLPGVGGEVNDYLAAQRNRVAGGPIVAVQTQWENADGTATYDGDKILRVPPTQVRLLVGRGNRPWEMLAPVGFSRPGPDGDPVFYRVNDNRIFASSAGFPNIDITWFFAVPRDAEARFLVVRNTRLPLPEARTPEPIDFARVVGPLADPDAEGGALAAGPVDTGPNAITTQPVGYTTHKVVDLQQTNELPKRISKNALTGFRTSGGDGNEALVGGQGVSGDQSGGRGNNFDAVAVSPSLRPLRLEMARHVPDSTGTAQGNQQDIYLTDTAGRRWEPFAYSLLMADGRQRLRVVDGDSLKRNTDLPLTQMRDGDRLYVYWAVPAAGITIDQYHVGEARQAIGYDVQ